MIKTGVNSIKLFFESQEMDCVHITKTKETPFEQLFMSIGPDEKGRDITLQIQFLEENLKNISELAAFTQESAKLINLQLCCFLPFQIKEECIVEVARLIASLNKSCAIPGFEFSEVDGIVYFRNAVLTGKEVDEVILLSLLGNVVSNVDIFSSTIEAVGTGKMTIEDVVKMAESGKTPIV